jgi:splicing factor 3A subunit 3
MWELITYRTGQKHYSKHTVYDAHLKSDKHQKKVKQGTTHPDPSKLQSETDNTTQTASSSTPLSKVKPQARITYLTSALLLYQPIPQLLADSRGEVERRMALTSREREAEMEEAEEAPPPPPEITTNADEDEEDEDGRIYNPLKLPLGWDGKPIPFWLYKLHGLGVSFSCEICSEASYQGELS